MIIHRNKKNRPDWTSLIADPKFDPDIIFSAIDAYEIDRYSHDLKNGSYKSLLFNNPELVNFCIEHRYYSALTELFSNAHGMSYDEMFKFLEFINTEMWEHTYSTLEGRTVEIFLMLGTANCITMGFVYPIDKTQKSDYIRCSSVSMGSDYSIKSIRAMRSRLKLLGAKRLKDGLVAEDYVYGGV